jgi:tetratricopeptide (TPR) repeat protein
LQRLAVDQAVADYTQAIKIDPRNPKYYNNRGAAHLMAKNYRQAVTDFTEAIQRNDGLANAYQGRGLAFAELGETQRSNADLARARELDPSIRE